MFVQGGVIRTVDTHTAGHGTRIVYGGIPRLAGDTVNERLQDLAAHHDWVRRVALCEPRGNDEMFGALLVPPGDPACDVGVIYADPTEYHGMCGHGTIGVVTAGIHLGLLPARERIVLDTPAGPVDCAVQLEDDRVAAVSLLSIPSFVQVRDVQVDLAESRTLSVDVAYGGNFFAMVDADQLGVDVVPGNARELVRLGMEIRDRVNAQLAVSHPVNTAATGVELVEFSQRLAPDHYRNQVVLADGMFDRSPCGTGTVAKMALLDLPVGVMFRHDSVMGTTFHGTVEAKTTVGGIPATVSRITGSAWVTGLHTLVVDPSDPFPQGFTVA